MEDVGEVSQYDVGLDDPGLPEVVSGVWGSAFAGVPDVAMLKGRQVRVARVLLEGVILAVPRRHGHVVAVEPEVGLGTVLEDDLGVGWGGSVALDGLGHDVGSSGVGHELDHVGVGPRDVPLPLGLLTDEHAGFVGSVLGLLRHLGVTLGDAVETLRGGALLVEKDAVGLHPLGPSQRGGLEVVEVLQHRDAGGLHLLEPVSYTHLTLPTTPYV